MPIADGIRIALAENRYNKRESRVVMRLHNFRSCWRNDNAKEKAGLTMRQHTIYTSRMTITKVNYS